MWWSRGRYRGYLEFHGSHLGNDEIRFGFGKGKTVLEDEETETGTGDLGIPEVAGYRPSRNPPERQTQQLSHRFPLQFLFNAVHSPRISRLLTTPRATSVLP